MDIYKSIAQELIHKLITETDQPEMQVILNGQYDEIQNAKLRNGEDRLTDEWNFDVHGEHCRFANEKTGQTLEVSLGSTDDIGNLDPYFFYEFLNTTDRYRHLTVYFKKPFQDMITFFEELEREKILKYARGVEYKKDKRQELKAQP
ncbi:MAG: hypothetical protein IPP15_01465 [Saprospiraceae bacterium]|uniref:DUF6896 domain-containing protein n=1 Tax=Candidatus Opimibacter skivensis TaxID=2982028 RepID=A0A9D7SPY2_9BACT|nr:hypothetical protein [Candidatus Opimibacter skivensis]